MTGLIEIAVSIEAGDWPDGIEALVERAARVALEMADGVPEGAAELSIVLGDDAMVQTLNRDYRGQDKPTNVLSFAFEDADGPELPEGAPLLLGDVVIAAQTVAHEALGQKKSFESHLSHLVMHGVLHLLGYDHLTETDAERMERLETAAMQRSGYPDPYADRSGAPDEPQPSGTE